MRISTAVLAASAALLAAGTFASAQTPGAAVEASSPPVREVVFAKWSFKWKTYSTGPYYPERAERLKAQGTAVIDCKVALNGELDACVVVSESPEEFGFGPAALRMASAHAITAGPAVTAGEPVAGESGRFVVRFHRQYGKAARDASE